MTKCKIISGTYFDKDNGEYRSYGITVDNGKEKKTVEDISPDRMKVEELADRIVEYGLSVCHVDDYVYDWLCEVYGDVI